ncbi:MAG: site-specific integrase [Bacteroidales bacterium]|nr:site-specific integrase [Bacteroidales bacterium]
MKGAFVLQGISKSHKRVINYRVHLGNRIYFKYSTGEKITLDNWDKNKKQPVGIDSKKAIYRENRTIWSQLIRYPAFFDSIINTYKISGETITKDIFKMEFDKEFKLIDVSKDDISFLKAYEEFIQEMRDLQDVTIGTIKKQVSIKNSIIQFKKDKGFKIDFDNIDKTFYNRYVAWARKTKEYQNNTVGRYIGGIKTFLNWATERGYNTKTDYIKFVRPSAPANAFTLTESELIKLFDFDFSENKRLDKSRDIFCLGAFTGMRFSDYSSITKKNISGNNIRITMQKTKSKVMIPMNYYSKKILEKYDYNMPIISNQKLNDYIKEICEIVGIDDEVNEVRYVGSKRTDTIHKKYEMISSHTSRRTFATIAMSKGADPFAVMKITGHKDINTFMKYVNITENQTTKLMNDIFGAPESNLKAV